MPNCLFSLPSDVNTPTVSPEASAVFPAQTPPSLHVSPPGPMISFPHHPDLSPVEKRFQEGLCLLLGHGVTEDCLLGIQLILEATRMEGWETIVTTTNDHFSLTE